MVDFTHGVMLPDAASAPTWAPEGHRFRWFTQGVPAGKVVGPLVPSMATVGPDVVPTNGVLGRHFTPQFLNALNQRAVGFGFP